MSLFRESEDVDPLGSTVEQLLTETEPQVTPQQLLEVVTEHLRKTLPGGLKGKAQQKVLSFLIEVEYRHGLARHVARAVQLRNAGKWNENDPVDNSDRVDDLIKEYKAYAGDDEVGTPDMPEIDQPVGPGALTRLHIAAMDGELEDVIRLVEKEGANPAVLDNTKMTPCDRAKAFGHSKVAEYLRSKMNP